MGPKHEGVRTATETGGLVELHTHILPGMDDGSQSVEMSLEMLRKLAEMGVSDVCATSHYYAGQNSPTMYLERRSAALKKLQQAMQPGDGLPVIHPAAEVAYFREMQEHHPERLCVEGTRTLMLEMPFSEWTDQQEETVAVLALDMRLNVVLVHPERFCFSKNNRSRLERLAVLPVALQVNADTLLHWRTRKQGLELLKMTACPLLGSDCHNMTDRPPDLKGGRDVVLHKLGERFLAQMDENARQMIRPQLMIE